MLKIKQVNGVQVPSIKNRLIKNFFENLKGFFQSSKLMSISLAKKVTSIRN